MINRWQWTCWGTRPHLPVEGQWTGAGTKILSLCCPRWQVWSVCQSLESVQQPSGSMSRQFQWQLIIGRQRAQHKTTVRLWDCVSVSIGRVQRKLFSVDDGKYRGRADTAASAVSARCCTQSTVLDHTRPAEDNIRTCTGLSVEESVRMTEDRDKWRKYVHGVANPRIEEGWRTGQNRSATDCLFCTRKTGITKLNFTETLLLCRIANNILHVCGWL